MPESARGVLHRHQSTSAAFLRVFDALLIISALWLANLAHSQIWNQRLTLASVIAVGIFFVMAEGSEFYRSWRGSPLRIILQTILKVWIPTAGILFILAWATKTTSIYSRLVMGTWMIMTPLLIFLSRYVVYSILSAYRARGGNTRSAAIVGLTKTAKRVCEEIEGTPEIGMHIKGVYADPGKNRRKGEAEWGIEPTGTTIDLIEMAKRAAFDVIYIALPLKDEKAIAELLEQLSDSTASVYLVPEFYVSSLLQMRWSSLGNLPTISVVETPFYGVDGWLKRCQDIVLSGIILPLILVPMALIAVTIKLTSKGPVLFRQARYGLDGNRISVWKFRTMLVCEEGADIVQVKKNDRRVTPFGRFLRRTSMDELPQFFNVLQGSMSIVGPRPHAVLHNEEYRRLIHGYMIRHKVKPGITGWAQINGWRGETDQIDKMKKRIEYDLWYIQNWSLWLDLKIIFLTVGKGVVGENAY